MIAATVSKTWLGAGLAVLVMAAPVTAREITGRHHAGDRNGVHGMALFGRTVHYLAHIPTMGRPHNEQLIMRVRLVSADGVALSKDFSTGGHSIRPTDSMSLDDIVVGAVDTFTADVFAGNFEHDAPRVHAGVRVEIEEVLVARNLPDDAGSADQLAYLFGKDESWLLNVIRGPDDQQTIVPARISGPAPGLSDSFALRVTLEEGEDGLAAVLPRAGIAGDSEEDPEPTRIPLELGSRIWCLEGPDFFRACS